MAFVASAVLVFFISSVLGVIGEIYARPNLESKRLMGAAVCVALAFVDIWAAMRGTYCPIGLRRQTPKDLMRRHRPAAVALAWGLDTGLAISTFRVASLTWGALAMGVLGFSVWWAGVAYGLAFVVPLMLALWCVPVVGSQPLSSRNLGRVLGRRSVVQLSSAALMISAGLILFMT